MANLTKNDVLKLAKLARIELTSEEVDEFVGELNSILNYVEQLQNADTAGLEPTAQVTSQTSVMRADKVINYGYAPAELLRLAPATEGALLKVRRIL